MGPGPARQATWDVPRPHNSHFSLVPILIYRLLLATAGRTTSLHVARIAIAYVVLLFVYVSRRVDRFPALLAAALLLFLGPGVAEHPVAVSDRVADLARLRDRDAALALDRRDRVGDGVACLLLLISICSSGIGLPFLVGAAFEGAVALGAASGDLGGG